jgi:protein SEY1
MWDKVLSTFKQTLEKAESTYLAKAKSALCIYVCVLPTDV